MTYSISPLATAAAALLAAQAAFAGQYVLELSAPLDPPEASQLQAFGVTVEETLSADQDSYAVLSAPGETALHGFLEAAAIRPEKISEVIFINSPEVGGGQPPGPEIRQGHNVYVVERPLPGIAFLGLEKKQQISKFSNDAVSKLGDIIEWDHSYLTGEGTYCIYRADSPETLLEHGVLTGAPIGKITQVLQQRN